MSKLQNQDTDIVYRSLTPPEYQQIHRHNDAVVVLSEHTPKEDRCLCGLPLTTIDWADHMADLLFPLKR